MPASSLHSPLGSGPSAFVGREAELSLLSLLLDTATGGRGGVALLGGEAGIGKTRLMEELAALAGRAGLDVWWGRCHEHEGAPAFWPWVQVLRAYAGSRPAEAIRSETGKSAAALISLVHEFGSVFPDPAPLPAVTPAQERFRLFDATTATLFAAARSRPLMLLLDDIHWADASSLQLLDFLAQDVATVPLLVIASYRDTEVDATPALQSALAALIRRPQVVRIALAGLAGDEVGQYIEAVTGVIPSRQMIASMTEETEGNPLFLGEMVRLLSAESLQGALPATRPPLPSTLRAVIGRRLERLSGGTTDVLHIAAAIGREFDPALVVRAGGPEREAVLDALEEAETARIIGPAAGAPGAYAFTHALIRETLYDALPTIRRARLHLRIAEALEAGAEVGRAPTSAELALHYRLAVPVAGPGPAAAMSRRAGEEAAAVHAWDEAIHSWQAALDLTPPDDWQHRCALLLALGEVSNNAGEREQAKAFLIAAADAARHVMRTPASAGEGARSLAGAALAYGGPGVVLGALDERQVDLLEEALAAVAPTAGGGDEPSRHWLALSARLQARLAMALFWTARRPDALAYSLQALDTARRSADPVALITALHVRRYVLWSPEHLAERAGFAAEMVTLAEGIGDAELTLQGLRWRVVDTLETGDIPALDGAIARYASLAEQIQHPYYRWYASLFRATRLLAAGDLAEGERLADQALAFGERAGDRDAPMFHIMQLLPTRQLQGRIAELAGPVRALVERYPTMLAYRSRIPMLNAELGDELAARRELAAIAEATSDEHGIHFARIPRDGNWPVTMVNLARACVLLADRVHAEPLYRLLAPFAGRNVVTGAAIASVGPTDHWLGALAALLGRADQAAAHFEAALALAERMQVRPQSALTQYAYAQLLLTTAQGAVDACNRAAALLDAALPTARALGLRSLERDIAQVLAATGSRARAPLPAKRPAFPDGLTAREVEILRLVAAGRANREIAETLTLSVVTVQNHIANIYRKADVRNRAEAVTYALRHGLSDAG